MAPPINTGTEMQFRTATVTSNFALFTSTIFAYSTATVEVTSTVFNLAKLKRAAADNTTTNAYDQALASAVSSACSCIPISTSTTTTTITGTPLVCFQSPKFRF